MLSFTPPERAPVWAESCLLDNPEKKTPRSPISRIILLAKLFKVKGGKLIL